MKKMMVASYDGGPMSVCYLRSLLMTYCVDEEPVFCIDSFLIEEEGGTDETLIKKVGCQSREPLEHVEAGTGLEYEKGNRLLKEQADYDCAPLNVRTVLRRRPKPKLKHDQTKDGDCAVTVFRTLSRPTWISQRIRIERLSTPNGKLTA